jgi:hypothetical protein
MIGAFLANSEEGGYDLSRGYWGQAVPGGAGLAQDGNLEEIT